MNISFFVELLQVSLGNREALSRIPDEVEWALLMDEAQRQCVLGLLLHGIEKLPARQRPPQLLLLQWVGLSQTVETAYDLQCRRARELTLRFATKGYRTCVLKGIGTAQLYPMPQRRECGDIDLWVSAPRKDVMAWLKSQCAIEHILWHHVDARFFEDVKTEIHFHPSWLYNPLHNRRLQTWFEQEKDEQMGRMDTDLGFAYPTVQFNAVYSLVHICHHLIEEGIGIRHIVDYYYIVRKLGIDKENQIATEAVKTIKSVGLEKLLRAMMWVLQEVCGMETEHLICEPDEREGRFLLDEIMRGGNFGRYRHDARLRNTATRMLALLPHYPGEMLWVVPWKLWHKWWRLKNA